MKFLEPISRRWLRSFRQIWLESDEKWFIAVVMQCQARKLPGLFIEIPFCRSTALLGVVYISWGSCFARLYSHESYRERNVTFANLTTPPHTSGWWFFFAGLLLYEVADPNVMWLLRLFLFLVHSRFIFVFQFSQFPLFRSPKYASMRRTEMFFLRPEQAFGWPGCMIMKWR